MILFKKPQRPYSIPKATILMYADIFIIGRLGIWQSLVFIETYKNLTYRGDPVGVKTFLPEGLDKPSEFYSPKYEGSQKRNPVYDGRATIYWNPSIRTDSAVQAKIDFFTSDRKSTLEVIGKRIEVGSGYSGQNKMIIKEILIK